MRSSEEGWIKLHRSIQYSPIWKSEPFNRSQAWIDLMLLANHKDGYIYVRDHKIIVKRGDVGWSQNRLASRWSWSRRKVRTFLNDLESEQQVRLKKNNSYTVITLINYHLYQSKKGDLHNSQPTEAQEKIKTETTVNQQENTNKNDKNDKKYDVNCDCKWDGKSQIDYSSFVDQFNIIYDNKLRVTDKKRKQIKARLSDHTANEIVTAWQNRVNDDWLNSNEGRKYLGDWNAAMRNSEKIDKYLNVSANRKPELIDEGTF